MFDLLFHSFFRRLSLVCCRIAWGLLEGLLLRPVFFGASDGASFFTESMGKHFSGFTNEPYLGLQAKYRCPSTDPSFFPGLQKKMYKLETPNCNNDLRKICSFLRFIHIFHYYWGEECRSLYQGLRKIEVRGIEFSLYHALYTKPEAGASKSGFVFNNFSGTLKMILVRRPHIRLKCRKLNNDLKIHLFYL